MILGIQRSVSIDQAGLRDVTAPFFSHAWEQRKVGDYLTESRIAGSNGATARKLTVKLWGKGVVPKQEVYSGSTATSYFVRRTGQFMYGKLDFLHQAFGIVPKELNGYESTQDSPAFNLSNDLNPVFFLEYVSRKSFYVYQGTIASGSRKAKRIHTNTFFAMPLVLPSKKEQDRIVDLFISIDNLIALHQRKLSHLRELKRGLLQKMFPKSGEDRPEVRFPGFADAWEQRKLTEIVNRVNKSSNSDVLPKVEFEDIVSEEGRLNKDISSKLDSRKGTLFKSENILYGKLRPYLKNWLFPDFEGVALGDFWVFEATDVSVPSFDYYLIQSDDYQIVANDTSGTKMPRSDWKNVSSTDFAIPSKDEQKQIGAFFKQLDDTITLHQRKQLNI
ncbi:restriction endonuclease subunit S [Bifidobacterium mongoliense]|uniref:restriction endonuclease subunit S n=1 Tax=Bifidobacterium mongoliense TaxID=518643 RepID=UPI0030EE62F9